MPHAGRVTSGARPGAAVPSRGLGMGLGRLSPRSVRPTRAEGLPHGGAHAAPFLRPVPRSLAKLGCGDDDALTRTVVPIWFCTGFRPRLLLPGLLLLVSSLPRSPSQSYVRIRPTAGVRKNGNFLNPPSSLLQAWRRKHRNGPFSLRARPQPQCRRLLGQKAP